MSYCGICQMDSAGNHAWDCPSNPLNINPPTFTVHGCPQGCVDQVAGLKARLTQVEAERDAALRNMAEANRETGYMEQRLTKAEEALRDVRNLVNVYEKGLSKAPNTLTAIRVAIAVNPTVDKCGICIGPDCEGCEKAALQPEGEPK